VTCVLQVNTTGLLPKRLQVYPEEQQARARAWQVEAKRRATQQRGELTGEQAVIEAHLIELHHHKFALEAERAIMVDLTNAQPQARDVTATINHEGVQRPAFARASQNVVATATLLYTLLAPSIDGVDKVYHQINGILGIAAT
jgi:hypothetical protein